MKPKFKWWLLGFFIILVFNNSSLYAQSQKTKEAMLSAAIKDIYSNPEQSIAVGKQLLSNSDNDPNSEFRYLMLLAQAYVMITDYQQSLEYANRALKIAEDNGLILEQINANTYLGNHYLRLNLNEKAWQALERSEKIIRENPLPKASDHIQGNVYLVRGYLFESDLNYPKAVDAFSKAALIFRNTANRELGIINLGVALTHKGRAQLEEEQFDAAEKSLEEAIRISLSHEQNGVDAFAYLSLAEVYSRQSKFDKSNQILFRALEIAQNATQSEIVKEVYKLLADNYLKTDDLVNFSKYNERYKKALNQFQTTENRSLETVAKSARVEKGSENRSTLILISSGILLIIIVFLFFRSNRMKKKMKQSNSNK